MVQPDRLAGAIVECEFTDILWVPDSYTGRLEPFWERCRGIRTIRACREGECFAIGAGLLIGGRRPLVLIQSTGLFGAGDSLRNVVHDLRLGIFFLAGYRGYGCWRRDASHRDSARVHLERVMRAWGIRYELVVEDSDVGRIRRAYEDSRRRGRAGAVLFAEP